MHLVQNPVQSSQPADQVVKLAAGLNHSGMIQYDGSVWLWGDNRYGQAGQADVDFVEQPRQIQLFDRAVDLSLGFYHTLILGASGNVYVLGRNTFGQLGRSDVNETRQPLRVGQLPFITAISAGALHSLALAEDGSVWAWGSNSHDQVGDVRGEVIRDQAGQTLGSRQTVPVKIVESQAVAIAAGGHHSLYLDASGRVHAWGANDRGQLGLSDVEKPGSPQLIDELDHVSSLAAGYQHNLAVVQVQGQADQLFAWGDHSMGQTGTGEPVGENALITSPRIIDWQAVCPEPEITTTIDQIAAGAAHSAMLVRAPEQKGFPYVRQHLLMWGDNRSTQLSTAIDVQGSARPTLLSVEADKHRGSTFRQMDDLALGGYHTLILSSRGLAASTGLNDQYQTGQPAAGVIAGFQALTIRDMIKPAFTENSQLKIRWKTAGDQLTIQWPAAWDNHDQYVAYHVSLYGQSGQLQDIMTPSLSAVFEGIDPLIPLLITVSARDQAHQDTRDSELSRLSASWLPVEIDSAAELNAAWPNDRLSTVYAADQSLHHWQPANKRFIDPLEVPWNLNDPYGQTIIDPPGEWKLPVFLFLTGSIGMLLLAGLAAKGRGQKGETPSERKTSRKKKTDTDQ